MKFIHIADLHAKKEHKAYCLSILDQLIDTVVEDNEIDCIIFAGDFWDTTITNTETSGFSEFFDKMKTLCQETTVYMIYGTQGHEPNGSLEIFAKVGAKVFAKNEIVETDKCTFVFIPEPRKSNYASYGASLNDAIQNDYKNICKEAVKRNKDSTPLVVVFHGEVSGSVYQNGIQVDDKTSFNKKLLHSIGAEYYALGHIHKPQMVFENCYYAGSAYPKDFGETHDGGFNLVTVSKGCTNVERVSFNLPTNVTEHLSYENIENIKTKDFTNKNLKLVISIDKLLKKNFDLAALAKEIKDSTNAVSVKINLDYKKESNIRSKSVADKRTLVEKFTTYADINDIRYTASTVERLQEIQDMMFVNSFVPCDSYELEYLSLRGAIGIKDGTGKDEINIDFSKYYNGVLALIGNNGTGKTTILENCHPYPKMLTRAGTLKEHFCLHKSHRILIYKSSSGKKIKISMLIDATSKCIGTKYFVEFQEPNSEIWTPYKSCDGSYSSYMEFVNSTFGPIEIFLRTSFYAKEQIKDIPDLSRATKGEKIELFSLLAGTDYLNYVSDTAKNYIKQENETVVEIKQQLKDYNNVKNNVTQFENQIKEADAEIEHYQQLLDIDNEELEICKKEQKKFDIAINNYEDYRKKLIDKNKELRDLESERTSIESDISAIEETMKDKDLCQEQYNWYIENTELREKLIHDSNQKINDQIPIKEEIRKFDSQYRELTDDKRHLSTELASYEAKIESIEIPEFTNTCYVCGQTLSAEKINELNLKIENAKNKRTEFEALAEEIKNRLTGIDSSILEINNTLERLNLEQEKLVDEYSSMRSDIDEIDGYMSTINIDVIKDVLFNAQDTLDNYNQQKNKIDTSIEKVQKEIDDVSDKINNIPENYSDKIARLERNIMDSTKNISSAEAKKDFAEKQLEYLDTQKKLLASVDTQLKEHQRNIRDYTIIQKAFGNEGIQVLELETAIPEIKDVANSILEDTYGDRFTLDFETQRESATGNRKIEDFIINVYDNATGRLKKLDLLCSGESVWIKQALYYAFSVVRSRRTGFCFRTRFLDESDGSLDSEARTRYLRMIESAHKACNATLTVLITHSKEIKDIVDQKLEL